MTISRIIPVLLLKGNGVYKTVKFRNPQYVGDPVNAVKIFNDKCVDELVILDIEATKLNRINFRLLEEIAGEAFMPMAYGGGLTKTEDVASIFRMGYEKVVINSSVFESPGLVREIVESYGSQSLIISVDVKKNLFGKQQVFIRNGTRNTKMDPVSYSLFVEKLGAGEILLHNIDRDGTWLGYDIGLLKSVSQRVRIPVVACGGAGSFDDIRNSVLQGGVSAAAAGSMFVYQKKGSGVLINFPEEKI